MVNVMSLEPGHKVKGKEINDWCMDQILHNGSHLREARRLFIKNYRDETTYEAVRIPANSGVNASNVLVFKKVI